MTVTQLIRILGIDPGSVVTGFGIIESDGQQSRYITHGNIRMGKMPLPERLGQIYKELESVFNEWQPQESAIEDVFVSQNAASALKLGQARGAAITVCVNQGLEVAEYSARSVKQAIVGTGAANKEQVQHMVKTLLNISGDIQADAADALAVALCHAHSRNFKQAQTLPTVRRRKRR